MGRGYLSVGVPPTSGLLLNPFYPDLKIFLFPLSFKAVLPVVPDVNVISFPENSVFEMAAFYGKPQGLTARGG